MTAALSTAGTIVVGWLAYSASIATHEDDNLSVAYTRIRALEQQVDELRAEFTDCSLLIIELNAKIRNQEAKKTQPDNGD